MNILTLDVGTSGMKGILYDPAGRELYKETVSYRPETPESGIAEQEPESFLRAMLRICAGLREQADGGGYTIDAISTTCQRSSIIPLGKDRKPLTKTIMWQDTRNREIAEELKRYQELIGARSGARLNTVYTGTKITWLKRNRRTLYDQTYKIVTIADYLHFQLTGKLVTDETYGSRSLLMNIHSRQWDPELLALFETEEDKLCPLLPPGSVIGVLCDEFAAAAGLRSGIPVISAGGDQQCGALGQGVLSEGSLEITVGTGAFMLMYSGQVCDVTSSGLVCGAHAVPGAYVLESSMLTCAALYNWAAEKLLQESGDFEKLNQEVAASVPGAGGCIALPYFQGRGTPDWNGYARGGFFGVQLGTTRGDLVRALLESIACEVRNTLLLMQESAGKTTQAAVGGGLTKQPVFCQLLSDAADLPLLLEEGKAETTARGAWMSAAVTLGLYADYEKAYRGAVRNTGFKGYQPDLEKHLLYEEKRKEMNRIYRLLYEH